MVDGTAHRGQEATAIVQGEDGEMGLIQDLSVSVPREYSELTGAGTNKVVDEQQTLVRPELSGTWGMWTDSLWKKLIDFDDVAEEIADTAAPPLFQIEVRIPAVDGTDTEFGLVDARPDPSSLEDMPDNHGSLNVDFTARDIVPIANL